MEAALEILPEELLVHLLTFQQPRELLTLQRVSKQWLLRIQAYDSLLWQPLAQDLWQSSLPHCSSSRKRSPEACMAVVKETLAKELPSGPPSASPWQRFYGLLMQLERNWASCSFTRRHWYHSEEHSFALNYSEAELAEWDEDQGEPEGWDKTSVCALAMDEAGGCIVTGGDDGMVRVWENRGRHLSCSLPSHRGCI